MTSWADRQARGIVSLAALGIAAMACSSPDSGDESAPLSSRDEDAGGVASADPGVGGDFGPSTDGGSPSADGCAAATKLVYTMDTEKTLRRFDPETASFTTVGVIDCPSTASPNSMAVARDGTAWVLYSDGNLFKVQTKDASCTATSFAPKQAGMSLFGMGFASDAAETTSERLYIAGYPPSNKLATIALDSMKVAVVGPIGANTRAELSGTGSGQLFGLLEAKPSVFGKAPFIVAELGRDSGKLLSQAPQKDDLGSFGGNFAFAAWGGDFWLFIGKNVHRYRPTTKEATKVATVDFLVSGAGVSTCAPHTPVK